MQQLSLNELWESVPPSSAVLGPGSTSALPEAANIYLGHAIASGTPLASAVRLRMHGEIRLKGWLPFEAEQVISVQRGMIWKATVRMYGLPIRGSDSLLDGAGAMRWKLLGLFPVMTASGPDITRSAAGRVAAECIWLPSALCGNTVSWSMQDTQHPRAKLAVQGEASELAFTIDNNGAVRELVMPRWGDPDKAGFRYHRFGGIVQDESTFGGYTIPTRLRIGWYFGTDRFEPEGEFFRVTVDEALYR